MNTAPLFLRDSYVPRESKGSRKDEEGTQGLHLLSSPLSFLAKSFSAAAANDKSCNTKVDPNNF